MSYNRATDFYSGVSRVLAAKPDVMFIGGAVRADRPGCEAGARTGLQGRLHRDGPGQARRGGQGHRRLCAAGRRDRRAAAGRRHRARRPPPSSRATANSYPGKDPSTEVSLNYSAVHATIAAMKLAGNVTDAVAIRAQMDKAFSTLPVEYNPNEVEGLTDKGGTVANTIIAVVENGKLKPQFLRATESARLTRSAAGTDRGRGRRFAWSRRNSTTTRCDLSSRRAHQRTGCYGRHRRNNGRRAQCGCQ